MIPAPQGHGTGGGPAARGARVTPGAFDAQCHAVEEGRQDHLEDFLVLAEEFGEAGRALLEQRETVGRQQAVLDGPGRVVLGLGVGVEDEERGVGVDERQRQVHGHPVALGRLDHGQSGLVEYSDDLLDALGLRRSGRGASGGEYREDRAAQVDGAQGAGGGGEPAAPVLTAGRVGGGEFLRLPDQHFAERQYEFVLVAEVPVDGGGVGAELFAEPVEGQDRTAFG